MVRCSSGIREWRKRLRAEDWKQMIVSGRGREGGREKGGMEECTCTVVVVCTCTCIRIHECVCGLNCFSLPTAQGPRVFPRALYGTSPYAIPGLEEEWQVWRGEWV